ncbi:MAG: ribonuclease domain-containing protein, partial [Gelidibacter sp.]
SEGGTKFTNDGRDGGQILPKKDANGNPVTYTEYDINKAPQQGATRGKERMVVGSDGKTYYTRDHYKGFKEFKD